MAVQTSPGQRRRVERSALSAFVPVIAMLPFSVLSLFLAWLPVGLLTDIPFVWVLLGFAATGPLLFIRNFQVLVLTPVLGARRPTAAEEAAIAPLWREIVMTSRLKPDHYVVRILPSDDLNAFACGGHLVVVTSFAVEELTTPELQGVLAHELSHHLGLHTVAITIGHWLSMPVVLFARIGVYLENVAKAARYAYGPDSPAIDALTNAAAVVVHAVSWIFTAGIRASATLSNLVSHQSEFDADQRAVRMGYGRELASALRRVLAAGQSPRPVGWRERIDASHPPARTRVARIEALLRHPAR
ncbi:M48 family metalloprotease [Ilumatobacter nonamiensis]|uniref:M48 family metalloprotease n=1 Tax=Ilumatobacter nonamiensis TaxID=467093 RepID=UPI0003452916|nr:M48 family metalloprotease [Ilumatobacter nonamiensis]